MMMMIVMIMKDDNDDGNNHGECRVQTKKSRWEFLAVRLLVLVDHGQKSAFRIKQIVESTFLTSENVKYDLERDITCFEVIDLIQLENNS